MALPTAGSPATTKSPSSAMAASPLLSRMVMPAPIYSAIARPHTASRWPLPPTSRCSAKGVILPKCRQMAAPRHAAWTHGPATDNASVVCVPPPPRVGGAHEYTAATFMAVALALAFLLNQHSADRGTVTAVKARQELALALPVPNTSVVAPEELRALDPNSRSASRRPDDTAAPSASSPALGTASLPRATYPTRGPTREWVVMRSAGNVRAGADFSRDWSGFAPRST
jgi:hypothetical protein